MDGAPGRRPGGRRQAGGSGLSAKTSAAGRTARTPGGRRTKARAAAEAIGDGAGGAGKAARDAPGADATYARRDLLWVSACGLAAALFAALLSAAVFGRMPHIQDSIAQLFQARIFASGRLWAPSPPLREFFDYTHMINDGRWYSQYPPGHALLLVPGVLLGAPWLINPALGGLAVFATGLLGLELFGSRTGRVAAVLGLASPFLIPMASGFMAHVSAFFALTFYLLFHFRLVRTGRAADGLAAGAFLALAILIRPYTALGVALPALLHLVWKLRTGSRRLLGPAAWVAAGGAAGALLLGLYNWGTTGSPFVPGYVKLYGPSHGIGFGKGTWGPPHTPGRGLKAAWSTLTALNSRLFGWPLTSLWPFAFALLPAGSGGDQGSARAGRGQRLAPAEDPGWERRWLLASIPLSLILVYVFYWYHDLAFGPRYAYEALGPLLVLSAFGLLRTGDRLAEVLLPRAHRVPRGAPAVALAGGLFLYAALVSWPALYRRPPAARAAPPATGPRMASYFQAFSPQFWGVSPALGRLVRARGLEHAIVFTRFAEPEFDYVAMRHIWFGSAFAHEEPDLARARVIYAHDRGEENARLMALFPDRRAWLYAGSIEGGSLREIPRDGSGGAR